LSLQARAASIDAPVIEKSMGCCPTSIFESAESLAISSDGKHEIY
jgi:hypothetical protein